MGLLDHMIVIFLVPEGTAMLFYNGYTSLRAHDSAQGSFFLPPPHPHMLFLLFFVAAILPCESGTAYLCHPTRGISGIVLNVIFSIITMFGRFHVSKMNI